MSDWYDESLHAGPDAPGYRQGFRIDKVLHRSKSGFQSIEILESRYFGRILALDGVVQTTERDEFVYHEMIAHQPMMAHGGVNDVLIIGGGDGGALREVLRHPVDKAVMVEIDGDVVSLSREYLPNLSGGAFDDSRAELIIGDGFGYVVETERSFDVIIVDSTDPFGPGEILFTDEFYRNCRRVLRRGGVMVTQNGVPFFQGNEVSTTAKRMAPHFSDVAFYGCVVPTYVGGYMSLAWAGDDANLRKVPLADISARAGSVGIAGRYWSPEIHLCAFVLPPFIRELYASGRNEARATPVPN